MCENIAKWQGQVDANLSVMKDDITECKDYNQRVLAELHRIGADLREIKPMVAHNTENVKVLAEKSNGDKYITFAYIREKYAGPIIVAGIVFVLFTVMPTVLSLVGLAAYLIPKFLAP